MSAPFPSWIRKTMWHKFSAQERMNAIQVTMAMYGIGSGQDIAMAHARGIPASPAWIKPDVAHNAGPDLELLRKRAARSLRREQADQRQRDVMAKRRQLVCDHVLEDIPGADHAYCPKCTLMATRSDIARIGRAA